MQPLISIIIPIYNVEQYLEQCLNSVLMDNYVDNMEVICVNDGSTDNSLGICDLFAERYNNIKLISQSNAGLSAARNTGLKNATGEYVYFLDSDDYLYPDVLNQMCEFIVANELEMACFNVLKDGITPYYSTSLTIPICTGNEFATRFRNSENYSYVAPVWMYVYKKSFLLDNNLWNSEGRLHEDEEFTPRALYCAKRVAMLNIPIQFHRVMRPGAITSAISKRHLNDSVQNLRDLYTYFAGNERCVNAIYSGIYDYAFSTLRKAYDNGYSLKQIDFKRSDIIKWRYFAEGEYRERLCKLLYINLYTMIKYSRDELPVIYRKLINRFV